MLDMFSSHSTQGSGPNHPPEGHKHHRLLKRSPSHPAHPTRTLSQSSSAHSQSQPPAPQVGYGSQRPWTVHDPYVGQQRSSYNAQQAYPSTQAQRLADAYRARQPYQAQAQQAPLQHQYAPRQPSAAQQAPPNYPVDQRGPGGRIKSEHPHRVLKRAPTHPSRPQPPGPPTQPNQQSPRAQPGYAPQQSLTGTQNTTYRPVFQPRAEQQPPSRSYPPPFYPANQLRPGNRHSTPAQPVYKSQSAAGSFIDLPNPFGEHEPEPKIEPASAQEPLPRPNPVAPPAPVPAPVRVPVPMPVREKPTEYISHPEEIEEALAKLRDDEAPVYPSYPYPGAVDAPGNLGRKGNEKQPPRVYPRVVLEPGVSKDVSPTSPGSLYSQYSPPLATEDQLLRHRPRSDPGHHPARNFSGASLPSSGPIPSLSASQSSTSSASGPSTSFPPTASPPTSASTSTRRTSTSFTGATTIPAAPKPEPLDFLTPAERFALQRRANDDATLGLAPWDALVSVGPPGKGKEAGGESKKRRGRGRGGKGWL